MAPTSTSTPTTAPPGRLVQRRRQFGTMILARLAIHARAPAEGGAWCGGHPDPATGWTEGAMPPMPQGSDHQTVWLELDAG